MIEHVRNEKPYTEIIRLHDLPEPSRLTLLKLVGCIKVLSIIFLFLLPLMIWFSRIRFSKESIPDRIRVFGDDILELYTVIVGTSF